MGSQQAVCGGENNLSHGIDCETSFVGQWARALQGALLVLIIAIGLLFFRPVKKKTRSNSAPHESPCSTRDNSGDKEQRQLPNPPESIDAGNGSQGILKVTNPSENKFLHNFRPEPN